MVYYNIIKKTALILILISEFFSFLNCQLTSIFETTIELIPTIVLWYTFFWFFRASPSWWPFFLGFRSNNGFFELVTEISHNNRPLNFSYNKCNEIDCWDQSVLTCIMFHALLRQGEKIPSHNLRGMYPSLEPTLNQTWRELVF